MKKNFHKKIKVILASSLLLLPCFQNAHAECGVGPVLFTDTAIGAAIGLGVGALVLVANQNSTDIAPNLATSALIGAGVGAVIGVVELSLSDCSARRNSASVEHSGFYARPMLSFVPQNQIEDLQISSSRSEDSLSFVNLNQVAIGVSLNYSL